MHYIKSALQNVEQGLERVIISKTITRYFHEKIEKLAIDLVKLENEQFALLALKLLVTCMYIGMLHNVLRTIAESSVTNLFIYFFDLFSSSFIRSK